MLVDRCKPFMMTPSSDYRLTVEDHANPEAERVVQRGLEQFNNRFAPADDYRPLNVYLRDESGTIRGGALGETYWGWLHVSILWVDEALRGAGHGSRLLAEAEAEARRRGCRHVHLDTLSFQALPFYQRLGYTLFGTLDDLPEGHQRFFLQKRLSP